jgi:hypothetical protein
MGGRGSGGARTGSGRKSKDAETAQLHGSKQRSAPKTPQGPAFELLPAPKGMGEAQRKVWDDLAPHACAQRTLTRATAEAFAQLCGRVVLLRKMEAQIDADGIMSTKVSLQMDETGGGLQAVEKKANDLLTKCMTMMQRVDQGMLRFRLSPMGKELAPSEQPKDEWAEFDEGPVQ